MKKDNNFILKIRLMIFSSYRKFYKKMRLFYKIDFKWGKAIQKHSRINDDVYAKMKSRYQAINVIENHFDKEFAREWMVVSPLGFVVLLWLWLDFSKSKKALAKIVGPESKAVLDNKLRAQAVIIMAFLKPVSKFLGRTPSVHNKITAYLSNKYITVSS